MQSLRGGWSKIVWLTVVLLLYNCFTIAAACSCDGHRVFAAGGGRGNGLGEAMGKCCWSSLSFLSRQTPCGSMFELASNGADEATSTRSRTMFLDPGPPSSCGNYFAELSDMGFKQAQVEGAARSLRFASTVSQPHSPRPPPPVASHSGPPSAKPSLGRKERVFSKNKSPEQGLNLSRS